MTSLEEEEEEEAAAAMIAIVPAANQKAKYVVK